MLRIRQAFKLVMEGAEIIFSPSQQSWQVADQRVRNMVLIKWQKKGFIEREVNHLDVDKEFYHLTKQGKQYLARVYSLG